MISKLLCRWGLGFALVVGIFMAVAGCNSTQSESSNTNSGLGGTQLSAQDEAGHDHSAYDHGVHGQSTTGHSDNTDMEKMTEALALLSEEDRQSAMKQHFCPVSGEMLGAMGAPEKVEVQGQRVWICCDGCKDKLLNEPEKYLAKLNN